ncbi:MAG: hypothetical protein R3F19_30175 [Verrucomicrobiales bacterium]
MATRNRKLAFTFIALALMALVGFAILEVILRATSEQRGNATFLLGKRWYYLAPVGVPDEMPPVTLEPGSYRGYDPDLGWSIGRLGKGDEPNIREGNAEIYYSDVYGYRCDKQTHERAVSDWSGKPLPETDGNRYDYVCIGDSFTHGDAVLADEAWPAQLGKILGSSVANLGVGGYGIDQAVMRYEIKNPSCDHVLLGLISGDLERATYLIYNFTYGDVKSKPIYEFAEGRVSIFNRPAIFGDELLQEYQSGEDSSFFPRAKFTWDPALVHRSILDNSYCVRTLRSVPIWQRDRNRPTIYQEDGERLNYCIQILAHLKSLTSKQGAKLTVVLLGEANSFSQAGTGDNDNWALLKSKLDATDITWIDAAAPLYPVFKENRAAVVNAIDGVHYTPEANLKVAEIVAKQVTVVH